MTTELGTTTTAVAPPGATPLLDAGLFLATTDRLKATRGRLEALDLDDRLRARLVQRLAAIADAAIGDLHAAGQHLDELDDELGRLART